MYNTVPNFGDVLNNHLWNPYLGEFLNRDDDILMMGIGTLLGHNKSHDGKVIVCGSGSGYGGDFNQMRHEDWKVFFVRGPKTAKLLELPPQKAITDPAILTPEVFPPSPKTGKIIFVPHWETAGNPLWKSACEHAGIEYVDPLGNLTEVLRTISGAKLVIAEAMHAAIIADSYRVPWVSVSTSRRINGFKWEDWTLSMEMDHEFNKLSPLGLSTHALNLSTGRASIFSSQKSKSPKSQENQNSALNRRIKSSYKKLVPIKTHDKILRAFTFSSFTLDRVVNRILKTGLYNRYFDRTVNELKLLSQKNGMLSDDKVLIKKTKELKEKLEEVRQYLERH